MESIFLKALEGKNESGRLPVWFMRQAGRYLPSYRQLRQKHTILEMFRTADLIVEVTELPIPIIEPDAAILFSDILITLDALNVPWDIVSGKGPVIESRLELETPRPAAECYPFVREAIVELRRRLKVPLIGFCGGPLTVASYIIEGGSSKELLKTRRLMVQEPDRFHAILERVTEAAIDSLNLQIEAGVQAVQLFESWANCLSPSLLQADVLPYIQRILDSVNGRVPTLLFCRGSATHAESLGAMNATGISLDASCRVAEMRQKLPEKVLQGNLDPALLYAPRDRVRRETRSILESMGNDPAYIFNLGHGVYPDIPVENVQEVVKTIHESAVCRA